MVRDVFCLADWVLVQDLGFLGGLGTDPNSMIPLILLFSAGYLALARKCWRDGWGWRRRPRRRAGEAVRTGRGSPGR